MHCYIFNSSLYFISIYVDILAKPIKKVVFWNCYICNHSYTNSCDNNMFLRFCFTPVYFICQFAVERSYDRRISAYVDKGQMMSALCENKVANILLGDILCLKDLIPGLHIIALSVLFITALSTC